MNVEKKVIQVTELTSIELLMFPENNDDNRVEVLSFIYKGENVGGVSVKEDTPYMRHLYELIEIASAKEGNYFALGITTQKEMLASLKGLRAIRKDLDNNKKLIDVIYLLNFDANECDYHFKSE